MLQPKTLDSLNQLTENLEREAERVEKIEQITEKVKAKEEEAIDEFNDKKIKLIPSPNFTECSPIGTFLPINMADETVTALSVLNKEFDFIDFIKEKLNYKSRIRVCQCFASEQIDAIVLAITSFEKNNAFILGDMAGIGKGRVCAAIMRYTYQRGLYPIFITHKPYLFTDIYRDLSDIGGLGNDENDKIIDINPIVLHPDGSVYKKEIDPETGLNIVAFAPLKNRLMLRLLADTTDKIERTGNIELPSGYNAVFLPYSTLSQTKDPTKQAFLESIASKSIIVFDESHNAASANTNSTILKRALPLVNKAEGVLFSSATYAKSPAVFNLYVVKTALRTAVPSLESISNALKVGGENVSEYIATGLVKEGQMIRRERSFSDCKKVTEYVGTQLVESDGKVQHVQLPDDNQRQFYNEAIGYFKELRDFSKTAGAKSAIKKAVYRKAEELGYQIADMQSFYEVKNYRGRVNRQEGRTAEMVASETQTLRSGWIAANRNKWIVTYSEDSIARYKMTFRENLFLAIKAKFAADKIIKCLTTEVQYKNVDGSIHNTPQKPIIAIKNTGSAIFNELKLKEGDLLKNDFSEYLKAIYLKLFGGEFTLRKVDNNIFQSVGELAERSIEPNIVEDEYIVTMDDFEYYPSGQEYTSEGLEQVISPREKIQNIQNRLNQYTSQIPFSVIDYLKYRIESTRRPSIYYVDGNGIDPKYGLASSEYFKMVEGTGRKEMLEKVNPDDPNSQYIFKYNDRPTSVTKVYEQFNNGSADVMLINVVASTGGSAQSNPKEGPDTRQRNMFIIQFELDVNTEVQKRGRVNRTGQLNSPYYTYIISQIPVELRTYLMFRKKLRKLDANTSADQTASVETAEITDEKGNTIEDIFNAYGFHVFKDNFIELPQNAEYKVIFDSLSMRNKSNFVGDAEKDDYNIERFNQFVRELELYPTEFQEKFFDEMNVKYIEYVNNLKATGDYQLELTARDYKAAVKQSVVVQMNSGTSIFSLPLFITDYYTINDKKIWSRDKVRQKINELAQGKTPQDFHRDLIMDYRREIDLENQRLLSTYEQYNRPKREDFTNDDDFETASIRYEGNVAKIAGQRALEKREMLDLFTYFKPEKPITYLGNYGMFLGYNLKNTESSFKYSGGSIEFVFCFLSSITKLSLKKTTSEYPELVSIKTQTTIREQIDRETFYRAVSEWKPDLTKRTVKRFFTGNILSGIVEANKRKANDGPNWVLTRFTNIDGSISTAIELKYPSGILDKLNIDTKDEALKVSAANVDMIRFLQELPVSQDENSAGRTYAIWNVPSPKIVIANDDANRAVAIVKTQIQRGGSFYDICNFEIMQPYVKDPKTGEIKEIIPSSQRWNHLYHDDILAENFEKYLSTGIKDVKYARYEQVKVDEFGNETRSIKKDKGYNVRIRKYSFNLESDSDLGDLRQFLSYVSLNYDLNFNFRSDTAAYLNTPIYSDPFDPTKTYVEEKQFEEGTYEYQFTKRPNESLVLQIPGYIETKPGGIYGNVVVKYPLTPIQCKSFEVIPMNLPNEVMVKLALSVLSDIDKISFVKELEEKAPVLSDLQVGAYVSNYLSRRSVSTDYFFGDLGMADYGRIFKEFAMKKDISNLILPKEETKVTKAASIKKDKVTFEDAERFLMILNP
jgi:hypothetical protein